MRQVERFAVAMLAFVLQHEPGFKRAFLQQVCGRVQDENQDAFSVELEVADCGDLVLRRNDDEVFVLEFKVDAPLSKKQDPREEGAFFKEGYGAGIEKKYPGNCTYIVVQNEAADFSNVTETTPSFHGKSWRHILECVPKHPKTPLVHDLFHSLGSLGIPAFINMNIKNKTPGRGTNTLDAVYMLAILEAVAGYVGRTTMKLVPYLEANGGCIEKHFRPTGDKEEKWRMLIQPTGSSYGTIGYAHYGEERRIEVWLFCGNKDAAREVTAILTKRFSDATVEDRGENMVAIALAVEKSTDDEQWFRSVFDSLVPPK